MDDQTTLISSPVTDHGTYGWGSTNWFPPLRWIPPTAPYLCHMWWRADHTLCGLGQLRQQAGNGGLIVDHEKHMILWFSDGSLKMEGKRIFHKCCCCCCCCCRLQVSSNGQLFTSWSYRVYRSTKCWPGIPHNLFSKHPISNAFLSFQLSLGHGQGLVRCCFTVADPMP